MNDPMEGFAGARLEDSPSIWPPAELRRRNVACRRRRAWGMRLFWAVMWLWFLGIVGLWVRHDLAFRRLQALYPADAPINTQIWRSK